MTSSGLLTIDLGAIRSNWNIIKSRALAGVETGAVIKANAYGLGAAQVAHTLYSVGCRSFFLATKEEALAIKRLLPTDSHLILLGGVRPGDERQVALAHLIPVLYSLESVNRWLACCRELGRSFPCYLKVDTGMTRLGLSSEELVSLLNLTDEYLEPLVLMSHLACAEVVGHQLNHHQLANFIDSARAFKAKYPRARLSLANSSGVFLGQDWHFDLLRPGAALYGINPTPGLANPMLPVVRLELPVLQVRELQQSAQVGYGAGYWARAGSVLVVVAGGYADGLHRTLGATAEAMFAGQRMRSAGRISMDSMVFDAGGANSHSIKPGDYFEVINDRLNIEYLMEKNATLGYEVLTSLGDRFTRVYKE